MMCIMRVNDMPVVTSCKDVMMVPQSLTDTSSSPDLFNTGPMPPLKTPVHSLASESLAEQELPLAMAVKINNANEHEHDA